MPPPSSPGDAAPSVTCFGVGDGWPCADRFHSSFLYRLGSTRVLIDCGDALSTSYKHSGESYDGLDRIFLSHLHSDHFAGLFMFVQGLWLEKRRRPLRVHLPGAAIDPLRRMLHAAYLFDELIGFRLDFRPLRPRRTMQVRDVRVTAFPTCHLEDFRRSFGRRYPVGFEAYSFLLEGGGLRIGHTADIGHVADLEPLVAKPLDHLVCELSHCEPAAICEALRGRRIGRISFVHLARELWADRRGTQRLLRANLGNIPFTLVRDGETVAL